MSKHTKTPLKVNGDDGSADPFTGEYIDDCEGMPYASLYGGLAETRRARAAHIVRCVNSHEALVEACKRAIEAYDEAYTLGRGGWKGKDVDFMRAAVKAATGGTQ